MKRGAYSYRFQESMTEPDYKILVFINMYYPWYVYIFEAN